MSTRTVPISSQELDNAIEVLASAGQALQLSRFESLSYRALMISADVAMASYVVALPFPFVSLALGPDTEKHIFFVYKAVYLIIVVSLLVGIISLALSIPLLRRAFRERARLKERGLVSLSYFLWKESRRSHWINRARGILLVVIGLFNILGLVGLAIEFASLYKPSPVGVETVITIGVVQFATSVMFVVFFVAVLLGARYLRNQRERMDLTASAATLRKILQGLRQRAGGGVVAVPAELLEQTARIESTQIAAERKEAVLQSIGFDDSAYAIRYSASAAAQRATLETADRLELVDLLDQLGTEGAPIEPPGAAKDTTMRRTIRSKRVEIEYTADEASRLIQIVAVAAVSGSDTSLTGGRHA